MALVMTPIFTQTLTQSNANVVAFNNIPQIYTDLKMVISARTLGSTGGQGMYIQFSGDGGNNYSSTVLRGPSIDSYRSTSTNALRDMEIPNDLNTAGTFSNIEVYMPNYANTSARKQIVMEIAKESNSTGTPAMLQLRADLWSSTAAITSIFMGTNVTAPNFVLGSTFSLYGIIRSGA